MKHILQTTTLFFFLLFLLTVECQAEIVVVVHPDNPLTSLSYEQVVDIYMGRQIQFPDGNFALPLDISPDSSLRGEFYSALVGKSIAQINAYWARLLFTGRATPPRVLPSLEAVIQAVSKNNDAIAYIDSVNLTSQVKAVFHLPSQQP